MSPLTCFLKGMSAKSLPSKFIYIIHANNTVSRLPYFTEYSSFVRLLMKQKKENVVSETMFGTADQQPKKAVGGKADKTAAKKA